MTSFIATIKDLPVKVPVSLTGKFLFGHEASGHLNIGVVDVPGPVTRRVLFFDNNGQFFKPNGNGVVQYIDPFVASVERNLA